LPERRASVNSDAHVALVTAHTVGLRLDPTLERNQIGDARSAVYLCYTKNAYCCHYESRDGDNVVCLIS